MSLGKRLFGVLLAVLGAVGIVVCLAGIAAVSIVASRLQQVNSRLFDRVDQLIDRADQRAAQAGDAVVGTRDLVEALKQPLKDSAAQLLAGRVASSPKIDDIERRLAVAMERADNLVDASASATDLIEQVLATIDGIASERGVDLQDTSDLMATIRSAQESLAGATDRVADVRQRLGEIRQNRGVDVNLAEITKISLGLVAKLDIVQERIGTFRDRLDNTKTRSARLHDRNRSWIRAGQWLILFLFAWGGAGQFCLLRQGWRLVRPAAPDAIIKIRVERV